MYQVTFFDCGEVLAVTTPNFRAAESLYCNLLRKCRARLWDVSIKGKPRLLSGA